jgi:hypothetical protein
LKAIIATVALLVLAGSASAATTSVDQYGTTLIDGRKVFPIVLAKGPELDATTPAGADGLDEVVAAGVNVFKTGPASDPWLPADIQDGIDWNRAAAARGAYTWVNLATLSDAKPGSLKEQRLRDVVSALERDQSGSAIALWKGADEPWWAKRQPSDLQYAYCLGTSHRMPEWCANPADSGHLWVTIEAPRGTPQELAPFSEVTDIHGVDHYPVTFVDADPDLQEIGEWTQTMRSITPNQAVWTTLQVCASGSSNPDNPAEFVLPTKRQERYMVYDAILNGARSLAFYGGNLDRCWNATDTAHGWNWTFWNDVLRDLVREIAADSPIAPALVSAETTTALSASDATTQAISRQGSGPNDVWVIAARSGEGSQAVTIGGLPSTVTGGTVYTEGRSIPVENGSFTDTFDRWDVHVYRFDATPPPPPPRPPPSPPPASPPPAVAARTPLSVRGVRLSRARQARPFRVDLLVSGERGSAQVSCSARVGRKALRAYRRGWTASSASCTWRLPRSSRGKLVRGVVRVDGILRRYSARIR